MTDNTLIDDDYMKKTILLAAILFIMLAGIVMAQGADPNNPHNLSPEQLAQAKEIQTELWCPVCQGVRLDACEQKVCQQMRDMIDQMLLEGKTKDEIINEFVVQYGVVILGEPPKQGFNLMAWLMPIVLVLAGLGFAFWMSRNWTKKSRLAATTGNSSSIDSPNAASMSDVAHTEEDDYLARVEQEIAEE